MYSRWALKGKEIALSLSGDDKGKPINYKYKNHTLLLGNALDDDIQVYGKNFYSKHSNTIEGLLRDIDDILPGATYQLGVYIYSGPGDDKVYASAWNDWIYGGQGADFLDGGPGYDEAGLERPEMWTVGARFTIKPASTGVWPLNKNGIAFESNNDELNGDKLFDIEFFKLTRKNDEITVADVDGEEMRRLTFDMMGGQDTVRFKSAANVVNGVLGDDRAPGFGLLDRLLLSVLPKGYGRVDSVARKLKELYEKDRDIQSQINAARSSNKPFNDDRTGIEFRNAEKFFLSDSNDEFYTNLHNH